jgi:hypothetical protein
LFLFFTVMFCEFGSMLSKMFFQFRYRVFSLRGSRILFFFVLLHLVSNATANDSTYERKLIERIYKAQSKGTKEFAKGLFPSYREYYFNRGTLKNDDNVFFTALVGFTLRDLAPKLDSYTRELVDSIQNNSAPVYKSFQNRRGLPVYSFWMTKPKKYFPNTRWLSFFKTNALPDDLDCSAVVLQAINAPAADVKKMHHHIQAFANGKTKKIVSTFRSYKKLPAYSTWLGHKVPIDFDVCAMSNLLVLLHKYDIAYTGADSASLKLITEIIRKRQYQTHPEIISPYYKSTPVILYHVSRLMSTASFPELEQYKNQLVADAKTQYDQADNFLDRIILNTSLIRWGVKLPGQELVKEIENYCDTSREPFVFFVANMAAMLPNPIMRFMIRSNIGRFDYYCPAYNDVLVLENLILKKDPSKK